MRLWRMGSATSRSVLMVAMTLVMGVLLLIAPPPAGAEGEPVPPFEHETWRIDITHSDEYWLNVRYKVFAPGWSYEDRGFSGAHVTGHSGCGEEYTPMLLNTTYAVEGEHQIIVYFGGHCTHVGDPGEETKYDRYPNGTLISVDATFEHFLPGESAASEMIFADGTVVVTGDAPPPISLGAISVSRVEAPADAADAATSSSTTTEAEEGASSTSDDAAGETGGGTGPGVTDSFITLLVGLVLGGIALMIFIGFLVRRRMGWGRHEAVVDAAGSVGVTYDPSDPKEQADGFLGLLDGGAAPPAEKPKAQVEDPVDPGASVPPSPPTGLVSDVTYRAVEVTESIDVVLDRPDVAASEDPGKLPAGHYMVAPPGKDGQTPIHGTNGTRLGVISNRDNPTLRLENFATGPRIDSPDHKRPDRTISIKHAPGDYLVGPSGEHGAATVYDATTGRELGSLHKSG